MPIAMAAAVAASPPFLGHPLVSCSAFVFSFTTDFLVAALDLLYPLKFLEIVTHI